MWGVDAQDVWAAGDDGRIITLRGGAWLAQRSGATHHLHALWGVDRHHLWVVGDNGAILVGDPMRNTYLPLLRRPDPLNPH